MNADRKDAEVAECAEKKHEISIFPRGIRAFSAVGIKNRSPRRGSVFWALFFPPVTEA